MRAPATAARSARSPGSWRTRTDFSAGSRPRGSQAFWVATPVGQRPVWQRCAWMQPIDSIASRPTLTMSQPSANATSALSGRPSLPAPMNTTSLVQVLLGERRGRPREKPSWNGSDDVVGEDQRRGAGAALAAVDR